MPAGWSLPSGKLLYRMVAYHKGMSKADRVILAAIVSQARPAPLPYQSEEITA